MKRRQRQEEPDDAPSYDCGGGPFNDVFEVGITDRHWRVVERRRLNRRQFARFLADQPASHIVMDACGTAHHWGRVAQGHGHRVTLLPVRYVKPCLRGNKTDRTDVDALRDAVRTGHIPEVTVKTAAQQEIVALHRIREQWMATRTARINALRGFFREHGIPRPAGPRAALAAVPALTEQLPSRLALAVTSVYDDVRLLETRIAGIERQLAAIAKEHETVQRLLEIPGVGLLTATALVGSVGCITAFRRARQFASWLGLTPREHSNGQASAAARDHDHIARRRLQATLDRVPGSYGLLASCASLPA